MKKKITLFLSILFLAASLNASQSKEEVIDKMIEVSGGEEKLSQLKVYEQFWHIQTKNNEMNASDYRMVITPSYLRSKLTYPDRVEIRILDKNNGTVMVNGAIFKAVDSALDLIKLKQMRIYTPLQLKDTIDNVELTSDEENNILSLKLNGIEVNYFVSKKNHLIEKTTGNINIDSKKVEYKTLYEDYRNFNGVMLPYREVKFEDGINTETYRLQETRFGIL